MITDATDALMGLNLCEGSEALKKSIEDVLVSSGLMDRVES
jgi:hypothetical protein